MLSPGLRLIIGACFASLLMIALWFRQRKTKNAGIVDVGWGFAIGVLGLFFAATSEGFGPRRLIAGALIAGWSLRLTSYLWRRVHGEHEDGRYATMRRDWSDTFDRRIFTFFQMQAAAVVLFSLPVFIDTQNRTAPLNLLDYLAILIWIIGIGGLTTADAQLAQFKSKPESKGKTCRHGLWKYSRHPNYFFEWIHWWSYVLLAIGSPYWWVAALIPILLLYFLLFVTGIPPTEAQALASRGDDYRDYQRTTSAFIPWFPKSGNR